MDFFDKPGNLKLLQELLKESEDNSSDLELDDRVPKTSTTCFASSSRDSQRQQSTIDSLDASANNCASDQKEPHSTASLPQTLSDWEQQELYLNSSAFENRETPEYRIIYKQSVAPEDIYLQMHNKTPATSSCEEMCLEILLPKETVSIDRMQLDVTPTEIDLQTPIYRLKLPMVQQIDPDRGNASWDDQKKILRLTVRMKREYDFINFWINGHKFKLILFG